MGEGGQKEQKKNGPKIPGGRKGGNPLPIEPREGIKTITRGTTKKKENKIKKECKKEEQGKSGDTRRGKESKRGPRWSEVRLDIEWCAEELKRYPKSGESQKKKRRRGGGGVGRHRELQGGGGAKSEQWARRWTKMKE